MVFSVTKTFGAKAMGERHQPGDVAQAVAGVVAGAKARSTDINGVGAVKDRFASDTGVAGRTKKFKTMIVQAHTRVVIQYKGVEMAAIVVRTGRRRKPFPPSRDDEFSLFSKVLTEKIFPSNHGRVLSSRIPDFPRHVVSGYHQSSCLAAGSPAVFSFG
jgi:hypothetical protein